MPDRRNVLIIVISLFTSFLCSHLLGQAVVGEWKNYTSTLYMQDGV